MNTKQATIEAPQDATRRALMTGIAALGVATATTTKVKAETHNTAKIESLIAAHVEALEFEGLKRDESQQAENAYQEYAAKIKGPVLVKISQREHLDITVYEKDCAQSFTEGRYQSAINSARETLSGNLQEAAIASLQQNCQDAKSRLSETYQATYEGPLFVAYRAAQDALSEAMKATDAARVAVLGHVCKISAEIALKRDWWTCSPDQDVVEHSPESRALFEAYFSQADV